ncbi:hypothetical protein LZ30DRAFT_362809 [Colletotrichum cereale]|nr:hypothetical protein LZ30DRAFT_362809 [Colletotrichum cereale]
MAELHVQATACRYSAGGYYLPNQRGRGPGGIDGLLSRSKVPSAAATRQQQSDSSNQTANPGDVRVPGEPSAWLTAETFLFRNSGLWAVLESGSRNATKAMAYALLECMLLMVTWSSILPKTTFSSQARARHSKSKLAQMAQRVSRVEPESVA